MNDKITKGTFYFKFIHHYHQISVTNEFKPSTDRLFIHILVKWNALGRKDDFGLPTMMTIENCGFGSKNTYYGALEVLSQHGLIKIVKRSNNQHKATKISITKTKFGCELLGVPFFDQANGKPDGTPTGKASDQPSGNIERESKSIKEEKRVNKSGETPNSSEKTFDYELEANLKVFLNSKMAHKLIAGIVDETNLGREEIISKIIGIVQENYDLEFYPNNDKSKDLLLRFVGGIAKNWQERTTTEEKKYPLINLVNAHHKKTGRTMSPRKTEESLKYISKSIKNGWRPEEILAQIEKVHKIHDKYSNSPTFFENLDKIKNYAND